MPDSDPLDVEIEIDLGLEEPEAAPESPEPESKPSQEQESAPMEAEAEVETAPETNESPADSPASESIDEIAASLASAIADASPPDDDEEEEEEEEDVPAEEPDAPLVLPEIQVTNASELDFRKVGISAWKVKVKIGLIYDFSDIKTLRKYISDGRVTNEDVISHNGKEWTALGDIPDLDAHFIDVYRHALARNPEALKAQLASSETPEELSEEAEELTNSILAQINQEVDSIQPAPDPVGPEFSDPFQDLKKAQRSRGAKRKKMSKARQEHKAEMGRQNRLGLILLGILVAVFWVINPFGGGDTEDPAQLDENTFNAAALDDVVIEEGPSEVEKEVQKAVAEQLAIAQAQKRKEEEGALEEPQRRVVRPPDSIALSDGASTPNGTPSSTRQMPASKRAQKAYRQGNYSEAVSAYKEAVDSAGGSPSPQIHLGYGKSLYHTGSFDSAMRHLIRAEKAGAADEEAYRFLIELHRQRGDDAGVNTYTQKRNAIRR